MIVKVEKESLREKVVIRAYSTNKKFLLNGEKVDFNVDKFCYHICDMTARWPEKLVNEDIVDGLRYSIVIKHADCKEHYTFVNKFPEDIQRLSSLIREVEEYARKQELSK